MRTTTIHVKIGAQTAQRLKSLSRRRSVPVGELVRRAVSASYQVEMADLNDRQRQALAAYQGGFISIGKLAEEMGQSVFDAQSWLADHDVPQNSCFSANDTAHA
jgi:hypothetical protein